MDGSVDDGVAPSQFSGVQRVGQEAYKERVHRTTQAELDSLYQKMRSEPHLQHTRHYWRSIAPGPALVTFSIGIGIAALIAWPFLQAPSENVDYTAICTTAVFRFCSRCHIISEEVDYKGLSMVAIPVMIAVFVVHHYLLGWIDKLHYNADSGFFVQVFYAIVTWTEIFGLHFLLIAAIMLFVKNFILWDKSCEELGGYLLHRFLRWAPFWQLYIAGAFPVILLGGSLEWAGASGVMFVIVVITYVVSIVRHKWWTFGGVV